MKALIYLKLSAFYNNILLNCCIIGDKLFSNYFKEKILYYKKQKEICQNYILFLSLANNIYTKYNINLLNIGNKLYNNYKKYKILDINLLCDDDSDISSMSDLSDMSDISDLSDLNDD